MCLLCCDLDILELCTEELGTKHMREAWIVRGCYLCAMFLKSRSLCGDELS